MSTSTVKRRPLLEPLSGLMSLILTFLLSNHIKRLFYFASLYANLVPLDNLKRDVMARLNMAMELASSPDALMMPAAMSRMVWSHDDVSRILEDTADQNRLELRAYELISIVPTWMKFGTMEQMKNETVKFLRFSDRLVSQAAIA